MQLLKMQLMRVVPACFVIGVSFELFMIKTGFYEIVTRKEGERRAEQVILERERLARINARKIQSGNDEPKF